MVVSEALRRVALTAADASGGLALSDAAGWNQTLDDWRVFIERGHAVGCHTDAGELVATAAAMPYGGTLGWVAMVLVAPAWRHRGLASALLGDCTRSLHAAHITPMLDATPAGAPIYRRLGFRDGFEFDRWEGVGIGGSGGSGGAGGAGDVAGFHGAVDRVGSPGAADAAGSVAAAEVRRAGFDDLDVLVALDAQAQGFERRFLLRDFLARAGSAAWVSGDGRGFVMARRGRRATQIGPLIATDAVQAVQLLVAALANVRGPVFVDVPRRAPGLVEWLALRGFARQRPFVRMALGATPALALHATSFALAGPEFG